MKRCANCGRTYHGGERFCREDGTSLHDEPAADAPAVAQAPLAGDIAQSDNTDEDLAGSATTVVGPLPQEPSEASAQLTPPPFPAQSAPPTALAAAAIAVTPGPMQSLESRTSASAQLPVLTLPLRPQRPGGAAPAHVPLPNQAIAQRNPSRPGAGPRSTAPLTQPSGDPAKAATLVTSLDSDEDEPKRSAYIGQLIDDRYLVQSMIGRGGMGAVFRCEQVHLKKTMAIKMLHESLMAKKQLIARFTREARAISRLSSPHTVMVYDFGRWGEIFYLVMELLEGEALDATLERDGPLPPDRVARLVLQMCDSLAEAHKHGIVHRDLKPENIMLVEGQAHPDFIKILDFGLAKVQGADDPYTIHSQRDIFGTPYYMSPEQIRAGEIDGRADVYAVGALMFRMLTAQHVFRPKNTFDILKAHLMEPPPKMADAAPQVSVPPLLEAIVIKALAKDPDERFQSMDELSKALVAGLRSGWKESLPGLNPPRPVVVAAKQPHAGLDGPTVQATAAAPNSPPARGMSDVIELDALKAGPDKQKLKTAAFFAALVLGVGGIAGGAWWSITSPSAQEVEPNDDLPQAQPLGPGDVAEGTIGKRRSENTGDRDCFLLPRGGEGVELAVGVTGLPNMDLQLTVHGGNAQPLWTLNHRGKGQGELLRLLNPRLTPTSVCVAEVKLAGQTPGESLSDRYTLRVERKTRSLHSESEPNDERPGNELQPSVDYSAVLDGPGDRDVFNLPGNIDGRLIKVFVELAPGQDWANLRLSLLDGSQRMVAARRVAPGELKPVLAFVGATRQQPDALVVSRVAPAGAELRADPVQYTLRYQVTDAADQAEQEPNNTEESAQPMVLGAWHHGDTGDSAAVDWLRIDGGDPAMQQIRIEAAASNSAYLLTVRDLGRGSDLRQLLVTDGAPKELLINTGTGEGYLLKATPAEGGAKARPGTVGANAARWRLKARVFTGE